jgi:predicted signal transduction protein with EAL and GGDEF domain
MDRHDLADALPDLALLVRRDGVILSHLGGRSVEWLRPRENSAGQSLEALCSPALAEAIKQLIRRAISLRETLTTELQDGERGCEVRVVAQSPNRALCIIRAASAPRPRDGIPEASSHLDRRGFLRRFRHSISTASLTERPLTVAVLHVDGLTEIARALDNSVSDQVMTLATRRIAAPGGDSAAPEPAWYMGQLAENVLVLVFESDSRELLEPCVARVCASLRVPVRLGDAEFHLTPYAGAAILGRDATSPKLLLEHARAAALEGRRAGKTNVCFFSDTLKLRSLARLDSTHELRDAIASREIKLRYVGRHDLASGRLVALVGYLQWTDPIRGDIRPADFLRLAEATGLSAALSRSVLECLQNDFASLGASFAPDVRFSFGALRHHILSDSFVADINGALARGGLPPERLELRIAERSYLARDISTWRTLADLGIQLVVDELGRQLSSLDLLARAPLRGLQLDRSWVTAVDSDPAARRVCGAVINVALGLGLTPIATGVDTPQRRELLAELGCCQGLGDLYELPVLSGSSRTEPPSAIPKAASNV